MLRAVKILFSISKYNTRLYFTYPKQLFWLSTITISDIKNKHLFRISKIIILDIRKKLLLISKVIVLDIQNNYFRYQKLCRAGVLFKISEIVILNIKNNYFRYQKINIYFGYQKLSSWISGILF